jgi:phage terminase large subunit GpA-like protein
VAAKEVVVSRLGIEAPGPGYCHFPPRDLDFFEQLLAEKPVRRFVNGVATRAWVKPANARNEALDCRVYSLCALHALRSYGFDLDRAADRAARFPASDPSKPRRSMADFAKLGS